MSDEDVRPDDAKPGDIIEITWKSWRGRKLLVIEAPPERNMLNPKEPGDAWFVDEDGRARFFRRGDYKISTRCRESVETDVDKSLKRQRDANLRGVF